MADRDTGRGRKSTASSYAPRYDATLYNFFDGTKYPENHGYSTDVVTYKVSNGESRKVSRSVVDLIGMMFDKDQMEKLIRKYSIDPAILESKASSTDVIFKALTTLSNLALSICNTVTNGTAPNNVPNNQITQLTNGVAGILNAATNNQNSSAISAITQMINIIPFLIQPVITTIKEISFYTKGLNDVLLIKDAYNIMKKHSNDENFYYKYYKELKTKIRPLQKDCDEYEKVLDYFKNSHGPTHTKFTLEAEEIFKISRRGEFRKYKQFKETYGLAKLLWHGAETPEFPSILLKGLQIVPKQASSAGQMFGKGIYFTDTVTKAANLCQADSNNPKGLLLLAEVALGETLKQTKAKEITSLPNGKHSVKGLGKYAPDQSGHFLTKNKVQVPLGKPILTESLNSALNYNEYVVYNPHQVLIQYLIQVKFNFN